MSFKQGAARVGKWVKAHPALSVSIVFVVVVATLYLTRRGGSTSSAGAGGMPYTMVMGGGDSAASLQAKAFETQAGIERARIEAEAKLMETKLANDNAFNVAQLEAYKSLTSLQLTAQTDARKSESDLAKYLIDAQFNPKTYATMEIQSMYESYGRSATQQDVTYWAGHLAGGGSTKTLQNALAADQVVLAGVGVTKTEANSIAGMYAKYGWTPTQEDLVYWGNQPNMEERLAWQLNHDFSKMVN